MGALFDACGLDTGALYLSPLSRFSESGRVKEKKRKIVLCTYLRDRSGDPRRVGLVTGGRPL